MHRYSKEQKEFLISNNYMKPAKELAEIFNKKFGTNLTAQNIKTFRGNHKLNSGLTGQFEKGNIPFNKGTKGLMKANKTSFKKGNIPSNHKEVGYERISVDGYIEVKVKEPNVFKLKHRVIYEQHYGEIPKGYKVIFADGNKLNVDLNNLILVSNSEEFIMNTNKLRYKEAELTKTGLLIAKVIDKTNKAKNERL
jgi:hypothetical protein